MILKVVEGLEKKYTEIKKWIDNKPFKGQMLHEVEERNYFFDGFDRVDVKRVTSEERNLIKNVPTEYIKEALMPKEVKATLFKNGEVIKQLIIDFTCGIYLMSNEGKTIERLN
jgi:hypothetical protein